MCVYIYIYIHIPAAACHSSAVRVKSEVFRVASCAQRGSSIIYTSVCAPLRQLYS